MISERLPMTGLNLYANYFCKTRRILNRLGGEPTYCLPLRFLLQTGVCAKPQFVQQNDKTAPFRIHVLQPDLNPSPF